MPPHRTGTGGNGKPVGNLQPRGSRIQGPGRLSCAAGEGKEQELAPDSRWIADNFWRWERQAGIRGLEKGLKGPEGEQTGAGSGNECGMPGAYAGFRESTARGGGGVVHGIRVQGYWHTCREPSRRGTSVWMNRGGGLSVQQRAQQPGLGWTGQGSTLQPPGSQIETFSSRGGAESTVMSSNGREDARRRERRKRGESNADGNSFQCRGATARGVGLPSWRSSI